MHDTYELFAVRYGHHDRNAAANFIGGDPHDGPMPLDYFVWVIRNEARTIVLDTGYDAKSAQRRDRELLRPVGEGLKLVGVDPESVETVILSHMHFDHAGNHELFPRARYHVQEVEMAFCTGPCMCHEPLRHAFDYEDVASMIQKLYTGRVTFHDGVSQIAPGITLHRVGGHSKGLQIVRVQTERGWVVLGSDASHFYANFEQNRPFPVVESVTDMMNGYETMRRLASSPRHIIPGHDPLVLDRYPKALSGLDDIVRLDLDPVA